MKDEGGKMKDEAAAESLSTSQRPSMESGWIGTVSTTSFILPPSSLRVLLWDIDGTLMRTRAGSFKDYTVPMLEEVFGTAGVLPTMRVSGMTDLQIIGEALKHEGFTHEHIREKVVELRDSYMKAMHKFTANGDEVFEILPGVREVLQATANHPRYRSALLTGNIE